MHPLFVFTLMTAKFCSLIEKVPQAPNPSSVLGVFGLSIRTTERDLDEEFTRFGHVEKVTIVYDQRVSFTLCPVINPYLTLYQSDRSRGFGFIRMSTVEEATKCITELNGIVRAFGLLIFYFFESHFDTAGLEWSSDPRRLFCN